MISNRLVEADENRALKDLEPYFWFLTISAGDR